MNLKLGRMNANPILSKMARQGRCMRANYGMDKLKQSALSFLVK